MKKRVINFLAVMTFAMGVSPLLAQKTLQELRAAEKSAFLQNNFNVKSKTVSPEQNKFDVSFYRLDLEIFPAEKRLGGSVIIAGKSRVNALATLVIDLFSNMQVDSVSGENQLLIFRRNGDRMDIDLPETITAGEHFSAKIYYHGNPQRTGFGSFNWSEFQGTPRIWTLSEPYGAPAWWPCKDDPADKADSVFINITVPENLVAASNGLLANVSAAPDFRITYSWD